MDVEKPKTMNEGTNIEKPENEPAPVQRLVMSRFSEQSVSVCNRTGNTRKKQFFIAFINSVFLPSPILTIPDLRGIRVQGSGTTFILYARRDEREAYLRQRKHLRPARYRVRFSGGTHRSALRPPQARPHGCSGQCPLDDAWYRSKKLR